MDAQRAFVRVGTALLLVAVWGCRAPAAGPSDPFAARPQPGFEGATAPTAAPAPGTSISKVAYDQNSAEGASIEGTAEPEPGFFKKLGKSLSSDNVEKQFKQATGRGPDENVAKSLYAEADGLFREKKFDEAAEKYGEAAVRWPDSLLEEDALYMQGESLFFADRYSKARTVFDTLVKKYENSRHLDRITARQFAIGRYWEQAGRDSYMLMPNAFDKTRPWFDTKGNGIKVYENIRLNDPTGPLADDAVMAQATAYFVDGRFDDASYQYEVLRKDYPQSDHQQQAHLLGLQSYLNAYQGPQYDVTPLVKAEKLADHTVKTFGQQMPDELSRMRQAQDLIRAQVAEREYDLGEYYRRNGYNRAATSHYAAVIKEYPETKFADLAKQQIESIKDLPPEPVDRLPWLTKMLSRQ